MTGIKNFGVEKESTPITLKFTISCGSGDGAYLCIEPVTKELYEYFERNELNLEEYALNDRYAEEKNIPENMQPFEPGCRASFGFYESGMTATDYLELLVQGGDSSEVFSGVIPKKNLKLDKNGKYAVILGNEVKGVQQSVVDDCDGCIEIPQYGTKHSLNVSVTGGIIIWEFFKLMTPNSK